MYNDDEKLKDDMLDRSMMGIRSSNRSSLFIGTHLSLNVIDEGDDSESDGQSSSAASSRRPSSVRNQSTTRSSDGNIAKKEDGHAANEEDTPSLLKVSISKLPPGLGGAQDRESEDKSKRTIDDIAVPPGITSQSKGPPGLAESDDMVGVEEMPAIAGTDDDAKSQSSQGSKSSKDSKSSTTTTNSAHRHMIKEHRRSIARQRRSSKASSLQMPSLAGEGRRMSRRLSRVRRMSKSLAAKEGKRRRRSSAAIGVKRSLVILNDKRGAGKARSGSGELKRLPSVSNMAEDAPLEKDKEKDGWLKCNDRLGLTYWLNMSTRIKEWVRPFERSKRRRLSRSKRIKPPGLSYFDASAAVNSDDDDDDDFSSDEDDLEPIPDIIDVGDGGHHALLPPRTQEFSKVFGLLRLSRDEIDAILPAVHVSEFSAGKTIIQGKTCEETVVVCRYGEIKVIKSNKGRRNLFGRSASQKYMKLHKGDCFGALHVKKTGVKRLEATEDCEVLILEHSALASCLVDKIKSLWDEYQNMERQRRREIKLRKQAILQSKMANKRGTGGMKGKSRRSSHTQHSRRKSEAGNSNALRDFATSELDGQHAQSNTRKKYINKILKRGSNRHNTRGASMRLGSIRRSQHGASPRASQRRASKQHGSKPRASQRRASKRVSISIVQDEHDGRKRGSRTASISNKSAVRKLSAALASSDDTSTMTNEDAVGSTEMHTKDEEPISSKDMSFEDAMAASKRAEAQNLRTMEYLSNYSERMLMEEEDNMMQILHQKDVAANKRKRKQRAMEKGRRDMMMKKKEELQRKAKRIQRERKRRDRKEKQRVERQRAEKERKEKERALRLKREQEMQNEERSRMSREEREQTRHGDTFWGIDIAEKKRMEELQRRIEEKLALWTHLGEQKREDEKMRLLKSSTEARRTYMEKFWYKPRRRGATRDDISQGPLRNVSVTVEQKTKKRAFFFQKKRGTRRK